MPTDLNQLFNTGSPVNAKIAEAVARIMAIAPEIYDREHLASHMTEKLTDPSHRGCSEDMNDVINDLFRRFDHDQLKLLIEQITLDVKPEEKSSGGLQIQTFSGTLEDLMKFLRSEAERNRPRNKGDK